MDIAYHDELDLDFAFVDDAGHPAPVENVQVLSSNSEIVEVVPDDSNDRKVVIRPAGAIGEASVTIRADSTIGEGKILSSTP